MQGDGNSQDGKEVCVQNDSDTARGEPAFQAAAGTSDKSPCVSCTLCQRIREGLSHKYTGRGKPTLANYYV